jgi:hypothetical protein
MVAVATLMATEVAFADDTSDAARADFLQGVAAVRESKWTEALTHFERSQAKKPHPVTSYNLGLCHRALGQHLRAKRDLEDALSKNASSGGTALAPDVAQDARLVLNEVERAIVRVEWTVRPSDARVSIDDRPLERDGKVYLGGTLAPGPAETVAREFVEGDSATFSVLLDPGSHTLRANAKGFTDQTETLNLSSGQQTRHTSQLEELPGTLHIVSRPEGAVMLNGVAVGRAPLTVTRAKGAYALRVTAPGYTSFETKFQLWPGQRTDLVANLERETMPITKKWWFYAIIAGVAAVGAVTTYVVITQTEDPPPSGGSVGWVVRPP